MTLTKSKSSPFWKMDFIVNGERVHRSTGERTKGKAHRVMAMARIETEERQKRGGGLTMAQLGEWDIARAVTEGKKPSYIKTLRMYWMRFAEFFGQADVTMDKLRGYIAWRRTHVTRFGEMPGHNTLDRELKCLNRGRDLAEAEAGVILPWPSKKAWPKFGKEAKRESMSARTIDLDLLRQAIPLLPRDARIATLFFIRTGIRGDTRDGEVSRIKAEHLKYDKDEDYWILHVREKVTRKEHRKVPVSETMAALIRDNLDVLKTAHKSAYITASRKVGLEREWNPRVLRAVFVTTAGLAKDTDATRMVEGHSDGSQAEKYDKVSLKRRIDIVKVVEENWPDSLLFSKKSP